MGRTRENQGIYSLNSWEKGAAVSEKRKAQLHSVVQYSVISERRNALCAITQEKLCYSQLRLFEKFQCVNKFLLLTYRQHLLDNEQCAANYNDKRFKILAVARNLFHLCLLQATFIKTKHPVLCKQKEFVYALKLFK